MTPEKQLVEKGGFDGFLIFEYLITAKMPPKNKKQPSAEEKSNSLWNEIHPD